MAPSVMLPQSTFDDPGNGTAGTIFGGPYIGPLTVEESGLTFIRTDRALQLTDAVARTTTGGTPAQDHAYLVSVGTLQNVIAVLRSGDIQPGSAQRHAPAIKIPAGVDIYIRSVQLAGAIEATRLTLYWA